MLQARLKPEGNMFPTLTDEGLVEDLVLDGLLTRSTRRPLDRLDIRPCFVREGCGTTRDSRLPVQKVGPLATS